jgi:hypothetical protein
LVSKPKAEKQAAGGNGHGLEVVAGRDVMRGQDVFFKSSMEAEAEIPSSENEPDDHQGQQKTETQDEKPREDILLLVGRSVFLWVLIFHFFTP